jgi:fructose-1,6-bisphosphatase/inositol monophosphatase family enzyme
MEHDVRYDKLITAVTHCAEYALSAQEEIQRSYKRDGSVVTKTDLYINNYLSGKLTELFPSANIISEESGSHYNPEASCYFILDPIDGTDIYSQGFPAWCIAVGILDANLNPIGGIISAPRWGVGTHAGLFLYRLPGEQIILNGTPFSMKKSFAHNDQLLISSGAYKYLQFSTFRGKLRSFGSTILHMVSPMLFSHVQAAVISSCYIWDIAAAHGIIAQTGMEILYLSGSSFSYAPLMNRTLTGGYALAGPPKVINRLQSFITPIKR